MMALFFENIYRRFFLVGENTQPHGWMHHWPHPLQTSFNISSFRRKLNQFMDSDLISYFTKHSLQSNHIIIRFTRKKIQNYRTRTIRSRPKLNGHFIIFFFVFD